MTIRLTFLCAPGGDATLDALLGDAPLNERGLREAGAARAALAPHGRALRGPSLRCLQTADALGLTAACEPALRDVDLGKWGGRTVDDIAATDPHGLTAWLTDPDAAPHGGESVLQLCRRTANWLSGVAPGTDRAVAVTEAAVVRAALIHALAIPARAFWYLAVPPLSAISLTRRGGCWDVRLDSLTVRLGRRWVLSQSGTPSHPVGDLLSPTHLVGVNRSGSVRETLFVSCG
ncbi:histidine phosphatase family protein [Streptomyces sp. NPDC054833]|jgi:broad specificity phosphatase PhoE